MPALHSPLASYCKLDMWLSPNIMVGVSKEATKGLLKDSEERVCSTFIRRRNAR